MRQQHLMIGLAVLVAAVAGPAWAEHCAPDASFAAKSHADCNERPAHHLQDPHSFDALAAVALHAHGKSLQHASEQAHALNAVPEPGTTALLIAGLAAVGFRLARRNS
ncbi:MAG TPA: PEP-CTERM sorting domain-containing protein [Burkholderiaceae bacterium]|nr:PEP-CTERM sorting domain-containing protein [Burkholderiaceae bacterium]